ncbi:MAG: hypothetical protein PHG25_01950 [Candidatus Pacebacteria bacterium]|nr:hypothetical protein [Candidatus Paceibacterota bacterium]
MFGKNFKYVLVLGGLSILTFTNPAVLEAVSSGMAYTQQQAAAGDVFKQGRPGFGFGNIFKVEVKDRVASTSVRRDVGSSTRPMMPFASSTRPMKDKLDDEKKEQEHRLTPEQVVTILFKAGIIPQEKLDIARKLINGAQMGTSTVGKIIREEIKNKTATSTRKLPPQVENPPLPPVSTSTTIM